MAWADCTSFQIVYEELKISMKGETAVQEREFFFIIDLRSISPHTTTRMMLERGKEEQCPCLDVPSLSVHDEPMTSGIELESTKFAAT